LREESVIEKVGKGIGQMIKRAAIICKDVIYEQKLPKESNPRDIAKWVVLIIWQCRFRTWLPGHVGARRRVLKAT